MAVVREHAGAGVVAVLYVALAMADGGFGIEVRTAAAVAIWWAVVVGIFVRAWPGAEPPRPALLAGGALAGLAALTGLSLLWAGDAGRAFDELSLVVGYLGLFALCVLASPRASARAWLRGLAAGLGALAAIALLSRFEPGLFGDAALALGEEIPSAAGRLSYPIGYWNALAACMALALVILVWLAAVSRTRIARSLVAASVSLPLLAIFLTQSTGGAIAAAVGLVALVVAARDRVRLVLAALPGLVGGAVLIGLVSRREELVNGVAGSTATSQGHEMLALTVVVVALAAAAAWLVDPRIRDARIRLPAVPRPLAVAGAVLALIAAIVVIDPAARWDDFRDPGALAQQPAAAEPVLNGAPLADAAGNGRYQWWSTAIDAFADRPIGGIGAGNFELVWNANATLPVQVRNAHSLYIETLAELGPAGLALLLAFLGAAAWSGIARRRSPRAEVAPFLALLAAGCTSAAVEWTWQIPAAFGPVVLAAAVLTGPATLRRAWPRAVASENGGQRNWRGWFGLGVATMLAGFASIWICGVALLTAVQLSESRAAAANGDLVDAATNANYAATIQPWAARPRRQLAQVEELRGRLVEADEAADEAIERAPRDWRVWVISARIHARAGREVEAAEDLDRAERLSPLPLPVELPEPR